MSFQEVQLDHVARQFQQAFEIAQAPGAVMSGDLGGFFQFDGGMFFGQLQQALHDAQALRAAGLMHRLGPGARERSNQPAAIQQIIGTAFNDVAFVAV